MTALTGAHGLLLAAGAGTRMGRPKALVTGEDGTPWLVHGIATLRDGGCGDVTVVLGAAADEAAALVPDGVDVVVADDWASGMSASLRAGLDALAGSAGGPRPGDARRPPRRRTPTSCAACSLRPPATTTLARATFDGRPGHPVALGRDHWSGVTGAASGDVGARDYLATHDVLDVECGDLATGRDVDRPPALSTNLRPTPPP